MPSPRVSISRLRTRIDTLAAVGRHPDGGATRLPFTEPHGHARRVVASMMADAGLEVGQDEFANVVGRWDRAGNDDLRGDLRGDLAGALLCGSHLDTVPHGGKFDGALGVMAAIESVQAMREAHYRPRHPCYVVAFADEEGAAFGMGTLSSRCVVGEVGRERFAAMRDESGRSLAEHLAAAARAFPRLLLPERVAAYLELHVEQGPELHSSGKRVAAVETITGIARARAVFTGRANHAGTTPMNKRADALWGAAELTLAIRNAAIASEGRTVANVGRLLVFPGAANVVPGRVELSVELRSPDVDRLHAVRAHVQRTAADIAGRLGVSVELDQWDQADPQPLDARVRKAVIQVMQSRGHEPVVMPSWAGHDARVLAPYVPAGMIFVPSIDGISHSPHEHTSWEDVEEGAQVLLETLLLLDSVDGEGARLPLAYAIRS